MATCSAPVLAEKTDLVLVGVDVMALIHVGTLGQRAVGIHSFGMDQTGVDSFDHNFGAVPGSLI